MTNGRDLLPIKFGTPMPFAAGRILGAGIAGASFFSHIVHIVGGSAEKQMIRIHTGAVIAAMADKEIGRDRATMLVPRKAMGKVLAAIYGQLAISVVQDGATPLPAHAWV